MLLSFKIKINSGFRNMLLNEFLRHLKELDDDVVEKAVRFWMVAPIEKYSFSDAIKEWDTRHLPPQPIEEFIRIDNIVRALGRDGLNTFIAVDQIISLLPNSLYQQLIKAESSERLSILRGFCKKIEDHVEGKSLTDLKPEDAKKEKVLLVIPSQKQLKVVYNNWDRWVWRRITYNGEPTPSVDGWIRDVLKLADAIKDANVTPIIVTDKSIEERVREEASYNVIGLDIPEDLAKIGYVRDQSVTWCRHPIIGNMALDIRQGEEWIINEVYYELGLTPLLRVRWAKDREYLVKAKMEGGNFFLLKIDGSTVLLTGVGVRGSNYPIFKVLSEILPEEVRIIGVPLSGYVKNWAETGAVHLDVVFTYLGELNGVYYSVLDPLRLGFYSGLEYNREKEAFQIISLGRLFKELGVIIDEPPREKTSPITMSNALNLGKGKLVADAYNREVNKYLEKEFGVDVIEVEIPQIEAGGGGPRCASRELWID